MKLTIMFLIFLFPIVGAYEISYYHNDHLGSTSTVTTEEGSLSSNIEYDLFGEPLNEPTTKGYNQKEHDETKLSYFEARYQDSETGRFLTSDNKEKFPNSYAYTSNNPLKYTDPTGNQKRKKYLYITTPAHIQELSGVDDLFIQKEVIITDQKVGKTKIHHFELDETEYIFSPSLYGMKERLETYKDDQFDKVLISFYDGVYDPIKKLYHSVTVDSVIGRVGDSLLVNINYYSKEQVQKYLESLPFERIMKGNSEIYLGICGGEHLFDGEALFIAYGADKNIFLGKDAITVKYEKFRYIGESEVHQTLNYIGDFSKHPNTPSTMELFKESIKNYFLKK